MKMLNVTEKIVNKWKKKLDNQKKTHDDDEEEEEVVEVTKSLSEELVEIKEEPIDNEF